MPSTKGDIEMKEMVSSIVNRGVPIERARETAAQEEDKTEGYAAPYAE